MTAIAAPVSAPVTRRLTGTRRIVVLGLVAVSLLAVVRMLTDTPDISSSGTFGAALRLAVPIGLAGLGGLYAERAGVVNIGLEGMMILGTWFGAWAGWKYGVVWGVVAGVLGGAVGGLLHAVATVTFDVNHIVSGVAINILAGGVARFLSVISYPPSTGGGAGQSPPVHGTIPHVSLPFLAGGKVIGWRSPDPLGWLEHRGWFLVSDLAGLARGLTADVSLLTLLAVALVPFSAWLLWRTSFGLRLRSVGEHPVAAESLGVPVYTMKYAAVVISGALAGLAGAFLVIDSAGIYREGQTGGRGFIGLACMIFGNWHPIGVATGATLFGFADALQLRNAKSVHSMVLVIAFALGLMAIIAIVRRHHRQGILVGVAAAGFAAWFLTTSVVPSQFVFFTPHLTTLVVLAFASQQLRMPAADGLSYRKGETQ